MSDSPASPAIDYSDPRGGNFYVITDVRVHEDDLTPRQRKALGLPVLPAPAAEPSSPEPTA